MIISKLSNALLNQNVKLLAVQNQLFFQSINRYHYENWYKSMFKNIIKIVSKKMWHQFNKKNNFKIKVENEQHRRYLKKKNEFLWNKSVSEMSKIMAKEIANQSGILYKEFKEAVKLDRK